MTSIDLACSGVPGPRIFTARMSRGSSGGAFWGSRCSCPNGSRPTAFETLPIAAQLCPFRSGRRCKRCRGLRPLPRL